MFGKAQTTLGNSSSDLVLNTLGSVKVKYGSKFVDIFKNGKLVVKVQDSFPVFITDKVGDKDGIYIIPDGDTYSFSIVKDKNVYNIDNASTFISYDSEQKLTAEQKEMALKNIGIIFKDKNSFYDSKLLNSIVYIQDENKLYSAVDGKLKEIDNNSDTPQILSVNSLKIGKTTITEKGINSNSTFTIGNSEFRSDSFTSSKILTNSIESPNGRFKLYSIGDTSKLICDEIESNLSFKSPEFTTYSKIEEFSNNTTRVTINASEEITSKYVLIIQDSLYFFEHIEENDYRPLQPISDLEDVVGEYIYPIDLNIPIIKIKDTISFFVYGKNEEYYKKDGQPYDGWPEIIYDTDDQEVEKELIFPRTENDETPNALIPSAYLFTFVNETDRYGVDLYANEEKNFQFLKYTDNSDKLDPDKIAVEGDYRLATIDWVIRKLSDYQNVPKGTIVMWNGTEIPEGWHICNGDTVNGITTPDLTDKFIKASTDVGVGNYTENKIQKIEDSAENALTIYEQDNKISIPYYKLIFIIKII